MTSIQEEEDKRKTQKIQESGGEKMEEERQGDAEKHKKKSVEKNICKRCKGTYDVSSNTPSSCRFHPSFFVSRRHDDQKRYYELGPDDPPYAAKFYDCCGAEDPDAPGCTTDYHASYDD